MNIITNENEYLIKKTYQAQLDLKIDISLEVREYLLKLICQKFNNKKNFNHHTGIDLLRAIEDKKHNMILEIANNNLLICSFFIESNTSRQLPISYNLELCKLAFKIAASNTANTHRQVILYNSLNEHTMDLIDILLMMNNKILPTKYINELLIYNSKYAKFILQQ